MRQKKNSNCYLFLGPELGEKNDAVAAIRGRLGGAEETVFYAGETPVPEITAAIRNGSLFSDARIIIVKNAEVPVKGDAEQLASCLASLSDGTVVILLSDETKASKFIEDVVPGENKKIFWELFENQKTAWVQSFFRREGFSIDSEAVETILEMVENNTDALRRSCLALSLFIGKGKKEINSGDVERCLSRTKEESGFTLFSAMIKGNLSLSLEILRSLLGSRARPELVFAALSWSFRRLRDYLELTALGPVNDFELRKIGLGSPKARAEYSEAAKRWKKAAEAESALALIARCDYEMRANAGFDEILWDVLVYKLALHEV